MEDELLFFKRFPEEKQDQVRGLIEYVTLMGLTGKDLVSIGGKLDRIKLAQAKSANLAVVNSYKCLPIGNDKNSSIRERLIDRRFKLMTPRGYYTFERHGNSLYGCSYNVTANDTKVRIVHTTDHWNYELPKMRSERVIRYSTLLDINAGKLLLDF
jgi:hypothetical protein